MMRFFLYVFLLFGFTSSIAQVIQWMSLNEALEAQKKEPKKIFIDVYTAVSYTHLTLPTTPYV